MTTTKLTTMAAASMLVAATTFAQAQTGASSPNQAAAGGANRITVTGCVERADQMNASGGSAAGASVDSLEFVLVSADAIAPAASSPNPAAGAGNAAAANRQASAGGTAGSGASTPIYRLGSTVEKLNPHVGHKVEVVGTREASGPNAASNRADPANPSTATAPRLMVESVKMLAASCGR